VASRRLRAALGLFRDCTKPKRWKRWRRHVRRVTEGLGAARDKDVQIAFVCGFLHELAEEAHCPGIARLLVQREKEREQLQGQVIEAVDRFQASGVLEEIQAVTDKVLKKNNGDPASVRTQVAVAQTRKAILEHLDSLLVYEDCLDEPEDFEQHHAMRIAAKRLRYTVEISDPVYDGGLAEHVKAVKQLQTFLGDVHDCDVWSEDLRAFGRDERRRIAARFGDDGPYERLRPGIEHLAEDRRARRRALFEQLVAYWRELRADRQWERLVESLEHDGHPVEQSPEESPSGEEQASCGESRARGAKPRRMKKRRRRARSLVAAGGNGASAAAEAVGQ
jgi:CHAD domain-containing protein